MTDYRNTVDLINDVMNNRKITEALQSKNCICKKWHIYYRNL